MKKTISLLSNLLLSSMLFLGVPTLGASEFVETEVLDFDADRPELNTDVEQGIEFSNACDHDSAGLDEIEVQRSMLLCDARDGADD